MSRRARTVAELLKGGPPPPDSLLAEAMRLNPALENFARRMSPAQEELLTLIVLGDRTEFGARERTRRLPAVRLGKVLHDRLKAFFAAYPAVEQQRAVEIALDRLLKDLGY